MRFETALVVVWRRCVRRLKSEAIRIEEQKEHTFKPQLATNKRRVIPTPQNSSTQKLCGLVVRVSVALSSGKSELRHTNFTFDDTPRYASEHRRAAKHDDAPCRPEMRRSGWYAAGPGPCRARTRAQAAALTWASSSTTAPCRCPTMTSEDLGDELSERTSRFSLEDDDDREESFFAQLQRERKQWDS